MPWEKQEDGSLEDVWDIVWEVFACDGNYRASYTFVCIDKRSGIDKTIIVVHPDLYGADMEDVTTRELSKDMPGPNIVGFEYVRAPGWESHKAKRSLDTRNEGTEDFSFGNRRGTKFRRASWPARNVVTNSYKYDSSEEEDDTKKTVENHRERVIA